MGTLPSAEFAYTYYPSFFLSFLFFLCLYKKLIPPWSKYFVPKYNELDPSVQKEWDLRILSNFHSVLVSCLCIYELLFDYDIVREPVWWDSPIVRTNCAILTGYVVLDMFVMTTDSKMNLETVMYYCHHLASAYAYYYVMSYGILAYFANFRMMAEFSTPFVNQRWFLDTVRWKRTHWAFIVNGLLMTFTFVTARVGFMPYYWYKVYCLYISEDYAKLGNIFYVLFYSCFVLDILNFFWSAKMLRGARKVLAMKFDNNSNIVQTKEKKS